LIPLIPWSAATEVRIMRNLKNTPSAASILLLILALSSSAFSLSLVDSMAGLYSRPIQSSEMQYDQARQQMAVRSVSADAASVSFFIGSEEGAKPSCSGENIKFVAVPDSQSLVYPLDQLGCEMKLTIVQGGGLKFESTAVCSIELCGAGNTLNQDGDFTIFSKE
jgi:hypothetical protein